MVETVQIIFWFYILANVILALLLLGMEHLPLAVVQWTVVTSSLMDGLFVAAMAYYHRRAGQHFVLAVCRADRSQCGQRSAGIFAVFLNVAISLCYVLVAVLDVTVMSNLDETTLRAFDMTPHEELGEPFVLRMVVLLLMAGGCYGAQVLLERQQIAAEEAGEFASRERQLRSAGRLAAEFAHQIKNPLAIINNAAFSLQRSLRTGKRPRRRNKSKSSRRRSRAPTTSSRKSWVMRS